MAAAVSDPGQLRDEVASVQAWYHTMELAPGVVTPGWFDLRGAVDRLPWPDVRGGRVLDVGTYDGFYAFEAERRGASEVVALDVPDPHDWDWPPDARESGPHAAARAAGAEQATGFGVARAALGSGVERADMTVYEIAPGVLGTFDVVICGSLLLHLRDPLRALEAIRSVCRGHFLSIEEVRLGLSVSEPHRPVAELDGSGETLQWLVPNAAGHRRMIHAAGFAAESHTRPFPIRFGPSHPASRTRLCGGRAVRRRLLQRLLAGGVGVPHCAVLAAPRV